MKKLTILGIILIALAATVALANRSQSPLVPTSSDLSLRATRACIMPAGGWTIIDCSNAAAAQSAQLNAWSRYVVQCGDDSYLATGDAATDEADSNDGWLPQASWVELMTTDTVRYISCLNKNSDSDCRYFECK